MSPRPPPATMSPASQPATIPTTMMMRRCSPVMTLSCCREDARDANAFPGNTDLQLDGWHDWGGVG